jgi:hypothetical protein
MSINLRTKKYTAAMLIFTVTQIFAEYFNQKLRQDKNF